MKINDVLGVRKAAAGDVSASVTPDEALILRGPEMPGEIQRAMTFDTLEIMDGSSGAGELGAQLLAGALFQVDDDRGHDAAS